MIEVFGRITSSNVQTVMWATAELGLEVKRHDVGGTFGGTDTPEYLAMNPNGLVPTLKDGDLTLFEANAIVRYLTANYGAKTGIWQSDIATRAISDTWMDWGKTTFYPAVLTGLFLTLVRTPKADQNPKKIELLVAQMAKVAAIVDTQLADKQFLAGENLSIADFATGTLLFRYFDMDFDRADLPNLRAYYDRLASRKAYQENAMIDYSSLRAN